MLCLALERNLGNIKIRPLLKEKLVNQRVSQKYLLYYDITETQVANDTSSSISKKSPKKVEYTIKLLFNLHDLRQHRTYYECMDSLLCLVEGLEIGIPFGKLSVVKTGEMTWDEKGSFYEWPVEVKTVRFSSTRNRSLSPVCP